MDPSYGRAIGQGQLDPPLNDTDPAPDSQTLSLSKKHLHEALDTLFKGIKDHASQRFEELGSLIRESNRSPQNAMRDGRSENSIIAVVSIPQVPRLS